MGNDIKKLQAAMAHPEIIAAVKTYLVARASAEVLRGRVDAIYAEVLQAVPVYQTRLLSLRPGERILQNKDLSFCADDAARNRIWDEMDRRTEAAGLRDPSWERGICPALRAESLQNDTERALITVSGAAFGVSPKTALGYRDGVSNWKRWVDLVTKCVVSLPGFVMDVEAWAREAKEAEQDQADWKAECAAHAGSPEVCKQIAAEVAQDEEQAERARVKAEYDAKEARKDKLQNSKCCAESKLILGS